MDEDRHQLNAWPRLDLAKLATLRAVVALGSFSAAGRELALTQPAVSRQIALLEHQVGTQLVSRTRQGVHPTQAGRLLADLVDETWVRAHDGSAARLVDHVLERASRQPPIVLAGHGDEPVEAQALVAAGSGIALTHELTVIVDRDRVVARPLDHAPRRTIQAAIMRGQQAPAARALLDALREVGAARAAAQAASRPKARTAS
jgi:DNA-binding transcriptional LysR family regulator